MQKNGKGDFQQEGREQGPGIWNMYLFIQQMVIEKEHFRKDSGGRLAFSIREV